MILLVRNTHHLLKIRGIRSHIHKRKLKADAGIKEVQEAAPFLKDSRLIFLLRQLVIDVLKLNGFGVVIVRHTANTVREHPLKRNALLCRMRNRAVTPCTINHRLHLFLLCG